MMSSLEDIFKSEQNMVGAGWNCALHYPILELAIKPLAGTLSVSKSGCP